MSEPATNYIDFMIDVLGYRGSDEDHDVISKAVVATSIRCSETPNAGDDFQKFFGDMKYEHRRQKDKGIMKSWKDFKSFDVYDSFDYQYNRDAVREIMFHYVDVFNSENPDKSDKVINTAIKVCEE